MPHHRKHNRFCKVCSNIKIIISHPLWGKYVGCKWASAWRPNDTGSKSMPWRHLGVWLWVILCVRLLSPDGSFKIDDETSKYVVAHSGYSHWDRAIHTCFGKLPWLQGSWGQHGAHLGPTGPRWATAHHNSTIWAGYNWQPLGAELLSEPILPFLLNCAI